MPRCDILMDRDKLAGTWSRSYCQVMTKVLGAGEVIGLMADYSLPH